MKKIHDIILFHEEIKGEALLKRLEGMKPLFICVIGNTETAKIPGISAAGRKPELTDYTPPADVELLLLGRCKCIEGVPVTPEGIPTPALITMSALKLADIPALIVASGLRVRPHIPFLDLGGEPGGDIRGGKAVEKVGEIMQRAKIAGENISKIADYLVIGESVPGGTTTALGVLLSMGVDAKGKVSSSMPNNPHELKVKVVEEGLRAANVKVGALAKDPIKAISCIGDPMMPAFAGLILGAAQRVPVLMAGGTQMGAILAIVKALDPSVLDNLAIGTTRWIIADKTSDLKGIIAQIWDIPILAADLNFSHSRFEGLRAYEKGVVKEGVGAGGAAVAAMVKSGGLITGEILLKEIERNYEKLVCQSDCQCSGR
ncbi:MAG: TIGR00303 family protein [Candidatus Bathyarchaeia archaeon]